MLKRHSLKKILCLMLVITISVLVSMVLNTVSAVSVITNLSVNDSANSADWSIQSNLQVGNQQYGDRTFSLTAVPPSVAGNEWIRTANDSKAYASDPLATFTVTSSADVYVAHNDSISTKPSWLSGWTDTGENIVNNESTPRTFSLYKKSFTANSTVSLGNNGSTSYGMYIVIVKPTGSTSTPLPTPTPTPTSILSPTPTPTPTPTPIPAGNLALNKTYSASSEWNSTYSAAKACDGTTSTRWASASGTNAGSWLLVDFGSNTTYNQVVIKETNYANITSFKLQSSNDASTFTDIASGTTIGASKTITFSSATSRYLRLYVVSALDEANVNEMEVYNSSSTPPPTTPTPYNVKTYGAIGDGAADDTTAINNAISAANSVGGGTVLFPAGTYSSRSIHLKSNVYLYLDPGSTIKARNGIDAAEANQYDAYQDYGHSHFRDALIWGENLDNIKITGTGQIDGNGNLTSSSSVPSGSGDKAISLKLCTNIEIGGVDINNRLTLTKFGHFATLITGCDGVNIHDIFVPNVNNNQRDVFDLMQCNDVTVTNIESLYSDDDVVKLGSDYSLGYKRPSQNITVRNIIGNSNCNVFQIGSETVGPISNVNVSDITVLGASKAGFGISCNDGSIIDGVTLTNCTMNGTTSPFFISISNRGRCPNPSIGKIQNVTISNVTATNCQGSRGEYTASIVGYKNGSSTTYVENITLNNIKITAKGGHPYSDTSIVPPELTPGQYNIVDMGTRPSYGWYLRHVKGIHFHNVCAVDFEANDNRYAVVVDDADNIEFDGFSMQKGSGISYRVQLKNTVNNFYMHDCPNLPLVGPANITGTQTY
jgi:polygalacturonase